MATRKIKTPITVKCLITRPEQLTEDFPWIKDAQYEFWVKSSPATLHCDCCKEVADKVEAISGVIDNIWRYSVSDEVWIRELMKEHRQGLLVIINANKL